jgi:hypothetical protein
MNYNDERGELMWKLVTKTLLVIVILLIAGHAIYHYQKYY